MTNPNFWPNAIKKKQFNYLYLLKNKFIDAYKFGVCENLEKRLETYTGINYGMYIKFRRFENDKWVDITWDDIELIEVYYGENVEQYEKELRKMINGNRKKVDGGNYRYLEHYVTDNPELHQKILNFFTQIKQSK